MMKIPAPPTGPTMTSGVPQPPGVLIPGVAGELDHSLDPGDGPVGGRSIDGDLVAVDIFMAS